MTEICLDKDELTIDDLGAVARNRAPVAFSSAGEARVEKTSRLVARWVREKKVIYGFTTGFGALCNVTICAAHTRKLQENILMSQAAGVGNPLPE